MKTLQEFINTNNNKFLDFDYAYGNQCYDLAQFWAENLGAPRFVGQYAYQIFYQAGASFTQIPNPPVGGPKEGDIVVWSYTYNYAGGHVGVATGKGVSTGAATDWFECFEQNDPTGSPCHLKTYSFNNVLGWLRPKNYTPLSKEQQMLSIINTQISDPDFRNKVRTIYGV